jgi:hypothetical protein
MDINTFQKPRVSGGERPFYLLPASAKWLPVILHEVLVMKILPPIISGIRRSSAFNVL